MVMKDVKTPEPAPRKTALTAHVPIDKAAIHAKQDRAWIATKNWTHQPKVRLAATTKENPMTLMDRTY